MFDTRALSQFLVRDASLRPLSDKDFTLFRIEIIDGRIEVFSGQFE